MHEDPKRDLNWQINQCERLRLRLRFSRILSDSPFDVVVAVRLEGVLGCECVWTGASVSRSRCVPHLCRLDQHLYLYLEPLLLSTRHTIMTDQPHPHARTLDKRPHGSPAASAVCAMVARANTRSPLPA